MLNTRGAVGWWVALCGWEPQGKVSYWHYKEPRRQNLLAWLGSLHLLQLSREVWAGMWERPRPGFTNSLSVPDDPLRCSPEGTTYITQVLHGPRAQSQPPCSSAQVSMTTWHPSAYGKWDGLCVWSGTQAGDSQAFSKAVRRQMEEHQMKIECPCLHFADCNLWKGNWYWKIITEADITR